MNAETKLLWLRRVLLLKMAAVLLLWGLPSLLGPAWFIGMFGLSMPADPFYLRMFGAVVTGLGLLYWFAYRNPLDNRDIIKYAVVDNALSTVALLVVAFTTGLASWIFWLSGGLTAFFTLAFWALLPKGG